MQLTIDPNDDINDVLRVVAALFDVTLEVVDSAGAADAGAAEPAEEPAPAEEAPEQPAPRGRRRAASGTGSGTGRGRRAAREAAAPARGIDSSAVRSWARENGYQVSDRGRISGEVIAAYQAAQG
ncbi:Lsr2 protein [Motilibacter rhizosphaerae]|uniref:Lsr2 protein n=1 Tax=Motilibacter rhizosphaerae TaxID=598652 RepID=A0A4Q7NGY9_9ACTN|nr:histone-like nucleoid-structuring protein Lsr2 [Motilibacter rhizosphaerae]RZS82988.1 Lsr2 protein [Motilibacter rhizosphaerae]